MKKVSAAPRNHAVRVPGRGRRSGVRHNPPLPSRGMTKSRNCGPCSTSCSAACKRTRVCCVSFPVVIRLWPFEPPPLPQGVVRRAAPGAGKGGEGAGVHRCGCVKGINGTFGHAAGDMVLREFAKLAREKLPDPATFARLGGDGFCAAPARCR